MKLKYFTPVQHAPLPWPNKKSTDRTVTLTHKLFVGIECRRQLGDNAIRDCVTEIMNFTNKAINEINELRAYARVQRVINFINGLPFNCFSFK